METAKQDGIYQRFSTQSIMIWKKQIPEMKSSFIGHVLEFYDQKAK